MAIKEIRAAVAQLYLARFVHPQLMLDGFPRSEAKSSIAIFGFGRLFGKHNQVGASLNSDVDFKVMVDDSILSVNSNGGGSTLARWKDRALMCLMEHREVVETRLDLCLEVDPRTVRFLSEMPLLLLNQRDARQFACTIFSSMRVLAGAERVAEAYRKFIGNQFPERRHLALASAHQFIGHSTKGSVLLIEQLPLMAGGASHTLAQKDCFSLGASGSPQDPSAWYVHIKTYPEADRMIGRLDARARANHWAYSLKYVGCRINDALDSLEGLDGLDAFWLEMSGMRHLSESIARFSLEMQNIQVGSGTGGESSISSAGHIILTSEGFYSLWSKQSERLKQTMGALIQRLRQVSDVSLVEPQRVQVMQVPYDELLGTKVLDPSEIAFRYFSSLFKIVADAARRIIATLENAVHLLAT